MKRKLIIYLLAAVMAFSPAAVFAGTVEDEVGGDAQAPEAVVSEDQTVEEAAEPDAEVDEVSDEMVTDDTVDEVTEENLELEQSEAKNAVNPYDPCKWVEGSNRSQAQDADNNLVKGLFKASKAEGGTGLYYAGTDYKVVTAEGPVTVSSGWRFLYHPYTPESGEFWKDVSGGTYTYLIKNHGGDFYIEHLEGVYTVKGRMYYVQSNGTVKTEAGLATYKGSTYYITPNSSGAIYTTPGWVTDQTTGKKYFLPANDGKICTTAGTFPYAGKTWYSGAGGVIPNKTGLYADNNYQYYVYSDGSVKTTAGFIKVGGKKYLVNKGGHISKTSGVITYNGRKYVAKSDGSIRIKKGFVRVDGKRYYVKNTNGVLKVNTSFKVGKNRYHAKKDASMAVGIHKWKGVYYYATKTGCLKRSTGLVTWNGKRYHVKKGGKVTINKKVKNKRYYYICGKKGVIKTGLFKWKGTLYYASSKGALKSKAGFVNIDGKKYFVLSGGKVAVNTTVWTGGEKYHADDDGSIIIGYHKWDGKYYITDTDGAIVTKKGLYEYKGKTYYVKSGGALADDEIVTVGEKHYYAGSDGAIVKKKFKYKGIWITPDSRTGAIALEDYYKLFPDEKPKPVEQKSDDNNTTNNNTTTDNTTDN